MYDAWTAVGVGGGSAALSWLAAGQTVGNDQHTLRLSIDKSGSLLGDVRLLGGALTWVASMYTSGNTKKGLQTVSAAAFLSLLQTELIRMRLAKNGGNVKIAEKLPVASFAYGALPGPNAQQQQNAYAPQGAWAGR